MAGTDTFYESDGKAVEVNLLYTVNAQDVAYAEGWLGVAVGSGESGDAIAISIDRNEYQFTVPVALSVSKGEIVRLDTTAITASHVPPDAAYNKSALSATNINLFKATSNKDANNVVTGILLAGL